MRKLLTFLIAIAAAWFAFSVPCQAQLSLLGAGATRAGPAPWTPAQISGLVAWYKADNDSTNVFSDSACTTPQTTNTGLIKCWKDKSGNGYNVVNSTGNDPTYALTGLNGKPTLTFGAAGNQYLRSASGVAMGTGVSGSAFAIGTMTTNTQSYARLVVYAPPSAADTATGAFTYILRTALTNAILGEKGNGPASGTAAVSLATETRFGVVANGTTIQSYVNGTAAGTPGSGSNAFISGGCISVGGGINSPCSLGGSNFWDGNVSEIVITNTAMSSGDIALLDAYLAARW